jgi:hypothetical protein
VTRIFPTDMTDEFSDSLCPLCMKDIESENSFSLTGKGLETIIKCASIYGHSSLSHFLSSCQSSIKVHERCRKKYTNSRELEKFQKGNVDIKPAVPAKKLRSCSESFDFKCHCLYCGSTALENPKNVSRDNIIMVRTIGLRLSILDMCSKRGNDDWSAKVSKRVLCCNDLVAEEARYHKMCHDRFHLGKQPVANDDECSKSTSRPLHRPVDATKQVSFLTMCEWLEDQTERCLYSVAELRDQLLKSGYSDDEVYSVKSLKVKLREHYGEHVVFIEHEGQHDVVCLRQMASFVLREQWKKEKAFDDDDTETQRLVKTAAKLIRAEMREMQYTRETYPTDSQIADCDAGSQLIPPCLICL